MSETSNTAQVTIKVQYKDDLRRFAFPRNGSYLDLEKTLKNIFSFSPSFPLVLKYQDDEKDWVTCSSDAELAAAFGFTAPNGILKLLIPSEGTSPVKSETPALVSNVNVAEPVFFTPVPPVASAPAFAPVPAPVPAPAPAPFDKKGWKEQKKLWKEEKKNWKHERKQWKGDLKDEKKNWKEERKSLWHDWSPEERAAWVQKKEAWKNMCKLQKEKMKNDGNWKCGQRGRCGKGGWGAWQRGEDNSAPCAPDQNFAFGGRSGCPAKWRARFVKHVTAPDGAVFAPGTTFTKTWRFRNESNDPWPVGSKIIFVGKNSDQMGGPDELEVGHAVEPGQEVDVSVPLVAPLYPGTYVGFWRMAEASGQRFGQRVRVQVQVQGSDTSSSSSSEEGKTEYPFPTPIPPSECFAPREEKKPLLSAESPCSGVAGLFGQLHAMGFTDQALNMKLAKKYDGDLVKIVKKLTKLQRKQMMAATRRASCPP